MDHTNPITLRKPKQLSIRLVACLTTIPSRVQYLEPTIQSLYDQRYVFDRIYLFLPKWSIKEQCEYPPLEFDVRYYPNLRVIQTEHDYGPITKLYPILEVEQEYPGVTTMVMTADDDHVYDEKTTQVLVTQWLKLKDENHAICFVGNVIGQSWYHSWIYLTWQDIEKPTFVDWAVGSHGVLYPLAELRKTKQSLIQWNKYDIPQAKYCDDLWISAMLQRIGCKIIVCPYSRDLNFQENKQAAETLPLVKGYHSNESKTQEQTSNWFTELRGIVQNKKVNRNVAMSIQKRFKKVFRTTAHGGVKNVARHYWVSIKKGIKEKIVQLIVGLLILFFVFYHCFKSCIKLWLMLMIMFLTICIVLFYLFFSGKA